MLVTATGTPVFRPKCDRLPGWEANNGYSYDVALPTAGGSYVTRPCDRGQIGPLRNCGFEDDRTTFSCTPGAQTTLRCDLVGTTPAPQTARLCEFSALLGVGTACTYQDGVATSVVTKGGVDVTFRCPSGRDSTEPGGKVSLYTAAVYPDDPTARMTCAIQ